MGREVRMVPKGWEHPKDARGRYIPLLKGPFSKELADWEEGCIHFEAGEIEDWEPNATVKKWKPKSEAALNKASYAEWAGGCPNPFHYMPEWPEGEATMYCMYEDTSEGTPISPAFATPEELARWLADTGASAFGGMTATYEQWLATCKAGWAVSAVIQGGVMRSGVEDAAR